MLDEYKTIKSEGEGYYTEKRSKFLAFAHHVENVETIKEILASYRKKYYDARHVCYAYMLGPERTEFRANDDGEPSSTAGKPILGQINSQELTDILIVVVRYYGGVNLGTSGLIVAYREAAADAIAHSEIETRQVEKKKYDGIVYKRRTSATEREAEEYFQNNKPLSKSDQITEEIDYFKSFYQNLIPAMVISYEREAYYDLDGSDLRITFDENILWRETELNLRSEPYGQALLQKDQTLAEIKVGGAMPLWLARGLSELGIFQTSFSKYGSAFLQKRKVG